MLGFSFSTEQMQAPEAPIQRYPVKIIFDGKTCGYYVFGTSNEFEIYFDVKYESRPGSRFMCLFQAFNHEDECRQWLNENAENLIKGQSLNFTDTSVELLPNPDKDDQSTPYVLPHH